MKQYTDKKRITIQYQKLPWLVSWRFRRSPLCCLLLLLFASLALDAQPTPPRQVFQAGAATSNITPKMGTSINGNMQDVPVQNIHDETRARCLVLDDGQTRLAIAVADLCMVSREVLDEAKRRAHQHTNIPVENMLMSATHTHSAGAACSVFQSDPDPDYLVLLSERIADAVIRAHRNLAPARIGWGVGQEPSQVFSRRARSSYLEVDAAPKITETLLDLLNKLQASQLSSNQNQPEPLALFNGKNLEGWYTFLKGRGRDRDPKQVFTVHDGLLRISGQEWGCITTDKEYENYKLVVEYKWGGKTFAPRADKARDNGVLLHSTGSDGGYDSTWMHSIECQIIEGGTGDFLVVGDGSKQFALTAPVASQKQGNSYVFQPGGQPTTIHGGRINWYGRDPNWKDVKGFRGNNDLEKSVGEWNRMECITDGEEVFIYLNGTLVNHATQVKPTQGRIQIQSEGAEMFVRKVELTPLPKE